MVSVTWKSSSVDANTPSHHMQSAHHNQLLEATALFKKTGKGEKWQHEWHRMGPGNSQLGGHMIKSCGTVVTVLFILQRTAWVNVMVNGSLLYTAIDATRSAIYLITVQETNQEKRCQSLSPPHALSVITVHVSGIKSMALVDMNCSQSLMRRAFCHSWTRREKDMLMVGENTLKSYGIKLVKFGVNV